LSYDLVSLPTLPPKRDNMTDKKIRINKSSLTLEPFQESSSFIFSYSVSNDLVLPISERLKILEQNLRLDHLNPEEKYTVLKICSKYNEIFFLPSDKLTCTDVLKHEIILFKRYKYYSNNFENLQIKYIKKN